MPESQPIRVAIVNDYELVVAGIAAVLAPFDDRIEVVELDSRQPVVSDVDVVLYDSYGQVQGSELDPKSFMAGSLARLAVFSWNDDRDLVEASLQAGAAAYLSKAVTAEQLVDAIERVHRGERVVPTTDEPSGDTFGRWPGEEDGLTARESEVLALICQGLTNQEITERAYIGINTLKTYIRSLYAKIQVDSRTRAVLWGIDHGFRPDRSRHLS